MKFNNINSKKGLKLLNSPYLVQYSENVSNAIKYALKKDLLRKYDINPLIINEYLIQKREIPLWVVEATCNTNLEDINTPAIYQYLWYCLHKTVLTRKQPSGREFKIKVNFSPCYVKLDNKIRRLLYKACNTVNLPFYKFTRLCSYKKLNNKNTISLLVLFKTCQILKIDIWNLLEDCELFGKNNWTGKIIIPKNTKDIDVIVLLVWLKTEGHLELGNTHIEINQKNNLESLNKIRELMIKKFSLKENSSNFPVGNRGEDRYIISSSPLRQFLCLRYNLPLGYKSGSLDFMDLNDLSQEDYKRLASAFVQTEGCLSYHYTRGKKKKLPRFDFIVKDESLANECLYVLKKLGFVPKFKNKQNLFKVGLYNSNEVIKLVHQIKPYVFDEAKIDYLRRICTNGIKL